MKYTIRTLATFAAILFAPLAFTAPPTTGQFLFQQKPASGPFTQFGVTPVTGQAFGWNGTAVVMLPASGGGTWGSITGTLSSQTDLQAALNAKQTGDDTLTALSNLTISANSLTIGTGVDAFLQTAFAASTFPARGSTGNLVAKTISDDGLTFLAAANQAAMRAAIGAGTGNGNGTVTAVSVATANGVSGSSSGGATPALTITLGDINPTGVVASGPGSFAATAGATALTGNADTGFGMTASTNSGTAIRGVSQTGDLLELVNVGGPIVTVSQSGDFTGGTYNENTIGAGSTSGTNTGDQTTITGNAGTATALQTARTINGTSFNGTANITVTAAAGTLTGTELNPAVVTSSLTSVGTLGSLNVSGFVLANAFSANAGVVGASFAYNFGAGARFRSMAVSDVSVDRTTTFVLPDADTSYTFPASTATLAQLGANTFTTLQTITQANINTGILASTGYSLTGSNATNLLSFAGTWNTSGNPTALRIAMTNTASGSTAKFLEFLGGAAGATSVFSIGKAGELTALSLAQSDGSNLTVGGVNSSISFTGLANLKAASGKFILFNAAFGDSAAIAFGGTTASQPEIRRSGTTLIIGTADGGTGGSLTVSGALTVTGTSTLTGGIVGVTNGSSAAAGVVGEYVVASVVQGSAAALTTATPLTVTSITLTAGEWVIDAIGCLTGASTGTVFDVGVSTTTNSFTGTILGNTRVQTPTVSLTGADASLMIPGMRVTISGTTTYYLVVQETFTIGSPAAYGRISARRASR